MTLTILILVIIFYTKYIEYNKKLNNLKYIGRSKKTDLEDDPDLKSKTIYFNST
jgi:hypothetical protein